MSKERTSLETSQVLSGPVFPNGGRERAWHGWTDPSSESDKETKEAVGVKARCPTCGGLGVSMGQANINLLNNPDYFLCPNCGTTFVEDFQ
jgi:predicted RNA-binding Zn-ribbon protein involved in translation (DUF1610 family)